MTTTTIYKILKEFRAKTIVILAGSKKARWAGCLLGLLSAVGCASPNLVQATRREGQELIFQQACPALTSRKLNEVQVVAVDTQVVSGALPRFIVGVVNKASDAFELDTQNISATINGAALHVMTFEEVKKQIENAAAMMAFATALSGVSASVQAAQPTYGTVATPYGGVNYTAYNAAQTAQAQAMISMNTAAQMQSITANAQASLNSIEGMLRRTTVKPETAVGGLIMLKPQKVQLPATLILSVDAGGEVHEFEFEITKPN